jgi:hypothetical protein
MMKTGIDVGRSAENLERQQRGRGQMEGCLFARLYSSGSSCDSVIDVWTARVSNFDLALPAHAALVVVWDDLFSPDTLAADIEAVKLCLANAFATGRADEIASAVFLDGHGSLGAAIEGVVGTAVDCGRRIAVIDCNATGPTALSWKDILPVLRGHYDLLIGIAHIPLAGPRTWSVWLADNDMSDMLSLERDQLALCDAAVLASDGLVGLGDGIDAEFRRRRIGEAMSGFINSLAASQVESALGMRQEGRAQVPRYFALSDLAVTGIAHDPIGAQKRLIEEEFGAPRSDCPIFHGPQSLWSFDPNRYLRPGQIIG